MIIIDFSQVAISTIQKYSSYSKSTLTKDLAIHLILNSIRSYVNKFKLQFGTEIVIATDNKTYWRKQFFPYYKIKRKEKRQASDIDWTTIYQAMDQLKEDITNHFPYKLLNIDLCEADDIIAVLTKYQSPHQKVLIISSDKDYKQLHVNSNIKQYSPQTEAFVTTQDPYLFLKEEIIKGQAKDSIPNILSKDSQIAENIRQKPITKKLLEKYLSEDFSKLTEPNIIRNKTLLDFNEIPKEIANSIIEHYNIKQPGNKQTLMKYLLNNKLIALLEVLDEF